MSSKFLKNPWISFSSGVVLTLALTFVIQSSLFSRSVHLTNVHDAELGSKLIGEWTLEDLRTAESDNATVASHSNGKFENDPVFAERWFCNSGKVYVVYRRIDGSMQDDGKDYMFTLVPQFEENSNSVQLSFLGQKPHVVLTRKNTKS